MRLVRTDEHGSQSSCRHQIGSTNGPSNEKVCMADKAEGGETCGTRHQGNEVALEADAFYIRVARNQILGRPFLPCSILSEEYVTELLADSKELIDWQTLFADILRASEDSSHATMDAQRVQEWQDSIVMPLRTPGRIRTRLMPSPSEDSEISVEPRTPGIHSPDTPEVDLNFVVEPEVYHEWTQGGLPPSLGSTIRSMEQGLDKANVAILGLHRDFSAMGAVMAGDVHALDCRVEKLQTTLGKPRSVPGMMGGSAWEILSGIGENLASNPSSSAVVTDIQTRLGSLAANLSASQQDVTALRVEKNALYSTVEQLESQLTATLEIALNLRTRLDSYGASSTAATVNGATATRGSRDVRAVIDGSNRPAQGTPVLPHAIVDQLSRSEFSSVVENMRAELRLVKKQTIVKGSLSCFPSLLPGVQSLEDVYSWVVASFGGAQGAPNGGDPDFSIWDDVNDNGMAGPTFGPFCDIYVLFAAAEDLDSILSKGDTLKEMDYIQKSGINHPAEAIVIYSLKRAVPGIFGDGLGSSGTSFLPKLKNAADWESMLSSDANAKPGLRDVLMERHEAIEAQLRGNIHDTLTSKGLGKAAELAREMLASSVKLLNMLCDYMTAV